MKKFSLKLLYLRILLVFKKAFLPSGYPHSVSDDYLEYQLWDSVQAFASSIMNNLATAAIFKGVGVGDGSATVLAATVTWLLKDGTSIIGSLVFATVQCTKMDSYCKRWRLFADLLNDCAIAVDLLSPALSGLYFTLVQCFSGVLRSLVGIAGGATRAALTQHQAKSNNLADVSAKDNSQERMVNLAALAFSLLIIPLVSERPFFIWCLFLLSTATHVYANYRAVRAVRLDVFNANRLAIFFEEMLVGEDSLKWMSTSQNTSRKYHQLSVASVNSCENVWLLNADRRDRLFSNLQLSYGRFESKDLEMEQQQQTDKQRSLFHFSDRSQRWYRLTMSQFRKKKGNKSVSFNLEGRLYVDRSSSESNYLPPEELTRLQLSLLYAVFLLNYCAEECQLKRMKRSSPRLQKIAQLVREEKVECRFEALRLAATTAETTQEELIKAAKSSGWRTSHMLISELFSDNYEEDKGGNDKEEDVYSEEEDYGKEREKLKKKE